MDDRTGDPRSSAAPPPVRRARSRGSRRAWLALGGTTGLLLGLLIRNIVTSPDADSVFILPIPFFVLGAVVLLAPVLALLRRSLAPIAVGGLVLVTTAAGAIFGPENPDALHSGQGSGFVSTVGAGSLRWSGAVVCQWHGANGPVIAVSAVVPGAATTRIGVDVYLGEIPSMSVGAGPNTYINGIAHLDRTPDGRTGSAASQVFPESDDIVSLGPFARSVVTVSWSCAAPARSSLGEAFATERRPIATDRTPRETT